MNDPVPRFLLRPARAADVGFAWRLYLETMRPLLENLHAWDEPSVSARFQQSLNLEETRIIMLDGTRIGWMQVSESDDEIALNQIHLEARWRSRGIGSRLLAQLLADAAAKGKPVTLAVVHDNPALTLYERFGFRVVDRDPTKLYMRWNGGEG